MKSILSVSSTDGRTVVLTVVVLVTPLELYDQHPVSVSLPLCMCKFDKLCVHASQDKKCFREKFKWDDLQEVNLMEVDEVS